MRDRDEVFLNQGGLLPRLVPDTEKQSLFTFTQALRVLQVRNVAAGEQSSSGTAKK